MDDYDILKFVGAEIQIKPCLLKPCVLLPNSTFKTVVSEDAELANINTDKCFFFFFAVRVPSNPVL